LGKRRYVISGRDGGGGMGWDGEGWGGMGRDGGLRRDFRKEGQDGPYEEGRTGLSRKGE
jgi:hypothetical protein